MSSNFIVVSRELERIPVSCGGNPFVQGPTHILHLFGVDRGVSVRSLGQGEEPLSWITKWFQKAPPPHFAVRVVKPERRGSEWVAIDQATARDVLSQAGVQTVTDVAGDFLAMTHQRWERSLFNDFGVEWSVERSEQIRLVAEEHHWIDRFEASKRCAQLFAQAGKALDIKDLSFWVRAVRHVEIRRYIFSQWIQYMPKAIDLMRTYGVGIEDVFETMFTVTAFAQEHFLRIQKPFSGTLYWECVKIHLYVQTHHEDWDRELKQKPYDRPLRVAAKDSGGLLPRSILYFKGLGRRPGHPMVLFNHQGRLCRDPSHTDSLKGKGGSSRVKGVMDLTTGEFYAIAVRPEIPKALKRYEVHRRFQGTGVADVLGRVTWVGKGGILKEGCIMPLYSDCLFERLFCSTDPPIPREQRQRMALELAWAVARIHRGGCVHRDIKPENVLIGRDEEGEWHAYLADFEYAGSQREFLDAGTVEYVPPECVRACRKSLGSRESHHHLSRPERDAWALGLVLWAIFMPEIDDSRQFGDMSFIKFMRKKVWDSPIAPRWLGRPAAVGAATDETEANIVRDLLNPNPHQRLSAARAVDRLKSLIANRASSTPSVSTSIGSAGPAANEQSGFVSVPLT